ncbi:MAG: hypothetical protein DRQ55_06930 [Planctomycetota bacterium]|nr:MAG: hypothetical protein DRQ55_06865 [Planctomycetota bacterium]RKY20681.1 MAG: hypothetical protein DRQ55_06930 [Planctomycetota bacterium]
MSLVEEINALRNDAALCRHGTRCLVRAGGGDLLPWLERIASLPVSDLAPGGLLALTLMDGKGKLRADPRVLAPGVPAEGLLLELPSSHREQILRLLRMYVITDDVTLEDLGDGDGEGDGSTDDANGGAASRTAPQPGDIAGDTSAARAAREPWALITLAGPAAGERLTACDLPAPGAGQVAAAGELLLAPSELSGTGGFDLIGPLSRLAEAERSLLASGVKTASPAALQVVRVGAGVPWFAEDMAGGVIPLEALLDHKVSSTKGCYPGQEVIARIVNMGQVARRLVRLTGTAGTAGAAGDVSAASNSGADDGAGSAGAPGGHVHAALHPDAELQGEDGRALGVLTSVARDPTNDTTLGLGYVKRSRWKTGAQVKVGDVTLDVTSLVG